MTNIDPATVQQCIDALTKLLPAPEQTEAENLADEWCESRGKWRFDTAESMVDFAQFILDKKQQQALIANPDAGPIVEKPGIVYGPWIGAEDDKTPDFPLGWSYQMRNALTGQVNPCLMQMVKRHPSQNTEYRAVFQVGKWYDWNRVGECPLPPDTLIQWLWDDETESDFDTSTYRAGQVNWGQQPHSEFIIKKFRIVGEAN